MNSSPKLYQENTTFTKRPAIPQIGSYIVFAIQVSLYYAIVIHHLQNPLKIIMLSIYSFSLASLIVSSIICSRTDPSDKAMIMYRNQPRQKFDEYKSANKDKYLFCDYCRSCVKDKSRHCRVCDRYASSYHSCTQNFDHHCMWINNCVGDLNYRSFFIMIISAFSNLLLYVITLIFVTVKINPSQHIISMSITWISGAINSIFMILLINLIFLHIYLNCNGLTTFQFILAQRLEQQKKKQNRIYPAVQKSSNKEEQMTNEILNRKDKIQQVCQTDQIKISGVVKKGDIIREDQNQNSEENKNQSFKKSIIFGQNDMMTQKSASHNGDARSNKPIIRQGNEVQDESQQQQQSSNLQISQLFMRNKSLKLIIGANQFYVPHKIKGKELLQLRQSKSKSMFHQAKRLKK